MYYNVQQCVLINSASCTLQSQVVYRRLSEMDVLMHQLADIRSALDSSSSSKTAGTDALLPRLASVLDQLLQVCYKLASVSSRVCVFVISSSLCPTSLSVSMNLTCTHTHTHTHKHTHTHTHTHTHKGCVASIHSGGRPRLRVLPGQRHPGV